MIRTDRPEWIARERLENNSSVQIKIDGEWRDATFRYCLNSDSIGGRNHLVSPGGCRERDSIWVSRDQIRKMPQQFDRGDEVWVELDRRLLNVSVPESGQVPALYVNFDRSSDRPHCVSVSGWGVEVKDEQVRPLAIQPLDEVSFILGGQTIQGYVMKDGIPDPPRTVKYGVRVPQERRTYELDRKSIKFVSRPESGVKTLKMGDLPPVSEEEMRECDEVRSLDPEWATHLQILRNMTELPMNSACINAINWAIAEIARLKQVMTTAIREGDWN